MLAGILNNHCNLHLSKADTKAFPAGWNVLFQLLSTQKAFHVLKCNTEFRRNKAQLFPVCFGGTDVEIVQSYKYLGVVLDNKLEWSTNTEAVYKKDLSRLYFLRRLPMIYWRQITANNHTLVTPQWVAVKTLWLHNKMNVSTIKSNSCPCCQGRFNAKGTVECPVGGFSILDGHVKRNEGLWFLEEQQVAGGSGISVENFGGMA